MFQPAQRVTGVVTPAYSCVTGHKFFRGANGASMCQIYFLGRLIKGSPHPKNKGKCGLTMVSGRCNELVTGD